MNVALLQNKGHDTITRREQVADRGYWYRVYIGPFSSLREAKLKRHELRKKKLVDYVAIYKKRSLIYSDLGKPPAIEKKAARIGPEKVVPEVSTPQEATSPIPKKPVKALPIHKRPPEAKKPPVPISPTEERRAVKQAPPTAAAKQPAKISAKPLKKPHEFPHRGDGRNMGRGNVALGLRHTYRKVEPELTKRKLITSDGTTTTTEDVSVASGETEDFTSLHMDFVLVRFGLTDYLEVFTEIGGAYRELSDLGLAYGGGLRLNLFEVIGGRLRGFYGGLQGEYLAGSMAYEYSSSADRKWKKEGDWEEFLARGELGVARSRFAVYLGGTYLHYHEDTERQLLESLPSSLTSYVFQDDLEEESFGAYGGGVIHLTSSLLLNIEGQVFSQESVFVALQYHF